MESLDTYENQLLLLLNNIQGMLIAILVFIGIVTLFFLWIVLAYFMELNSK